MFKRLALALILVLALTGVSYGAEQCRASGLKTADAAIVGGPAHFCGILIVTNGTNDASVIVYDNASEASGTEVFKGTVSGANNFGGGFVYTTNVKGIYVDVSGTGAAYIVYYR